MVWRLRYYNKCKFQMVEVMAHGGRLVQLKVVDTTSDDKPTTISKTWKKGKRGKKKRQK